MDRATAILVALIVAPTAIVFMLALIRGYSIRIEMTRGKRRRSAQFGRPDDEDEEWDK
jgi:hypothetical protein